MSTKRFLKWIAGFMSVIMLITILPMQAIAQQVHALETATSVTLSEEEILATLPQADEQPIAAPIIEEVEEKRDAFTKHFMTSEHTFIAATYMPFIMKKMAPGKRSIILCN